MCFTNPVCPKFDLSHNKMGQGIGVPGWQSCKYLWMCIVQYYSGECVTVQRDSYTGYTKECTQTLQWHHNGPDGVSNHQRFECLFNCLFRRRSKKTSKSRVCGLCEGNSPVTGEFPSQRAGNTENVSIWWRHHDFCAVFCFGISSVDNSFMWWIYPYCLGSLHWHWGDHMIAQCH